MVVTALGLLFLFPEKKVFYLEELPTIKKVKSQGNLYIPLTIINEVIFLLCEPDHIMHNYFTFCQLKKSLNKWLRLLCVGA